MRSRSLTAPCRFRVQAIYTARTAGKCKPDADGDGVIDFFDARPNTPSGSIVNTVGCPVSVPGAIVTVYATLTGPNGLSFYPSVVLLSR